MEIRDTRYATTPDGVYIAYQVSGDGPIDLVWQFDHTGDVDLAWERPTMGSFFRAMAGIGRLILHDRRGTGLSSRNVPPPDLETRSADLMLVLDTIGSVRPVLMGTENDTAGDGFFVTSTAPPAPFDAPVTSSRPCGTSGSRCAPACTRASAKSWTANTPVSPCRSAPA